MSSEPKKGLIDERFKYQGKNWWVKGHLNNVRVLICTMPSGNTHGYHTI